MHPRINTLKYGCYGTAYQRSHKKRKDNLEARAVLLIFLRESEIYGMVVQELQQNSENGCLQLRFTLRKRLTFRYFSFLSLRCKCF